MQVKSSDVELPTRWIFALASRELWLHYIRYQQVCSPIELLMVINNELDTLNHLLTIHQCYTFIACWWGKYENLFTQEYHIPRGWINFIFHISCTRIKKKVKTQKKSHCNGCLQMMRSECLSKNDNSGGKTCEASEVVEYDFCPVWSRVLIFNHCPIKLFNWCRQLIKYNTVIS